MSFWKLTPSEKLIEMHNRYSVEYSGRRSYQRAFKKAEKQLKELTLALKYVDKTLAHGINDRGISAILKRVGKALKTI